MAEAAPLALPEDLRARVDERRRAWDAEGFQYDFLLADQSERWRRGSVVTSRLLSAMRRGFGGHVEKK